jgi:hypothetical protein
LSRWLTQCNDWHIPQVIDPSETVVVSDEEHGRFFGHHLRFRERYGGVRWRYHSTSASAGRLLCRYTNIADAYSPGGIARAVGWEGRPLNDRPLIEVAHAIRDAVRADATVLAYPVVSRLTQLVFMGADAIYQLEQPLMLEYTDHKVFVREGNHRYLALLLLGEDPVRGYDWNSIEQLDA